MQIEKYMDLTVNPGDDFYKYATGHWVDYNKPKPEYPSWGVFNVLTEKNIKRIEKIIKNPDDSIMGRKINDFYNICLNWDKRNADGYAPLIEYLNKNVYSLNNREDIFNWCAENHSLPFFHMYIGIDQENADMNEVCISQAGLSLGNKDYYLLTDKENKKIIRAWKKYCISLYMAIGLSKEDAIAKYKTIWKIEKSMAKRSMSVEDRRNPELNYHKKNVSTLCRQYNFDFDTLLKKYGYTDTNKVIVRQEKPVKFGCKLMNELSLDDLKTIIEWQLIDFASNHLSDEFDKISFKFAKVMSGVKKRMNKKKIAVNVTNGMFGDAIGQIYAKKYFGSKEKTDVLYMISNLQDSFKEIISEKEWLSDETKQKAFDKIDSLRIKIGYPNKIEDFSDCPVDKNKTYFENCIALHEYFIQKDTEKNYNKPVDKDEWYMYPHDINAYYNATTNEICFPAGILQAPFYDFKQSSAKNYGGIGVIIGHEMTHGYDNHGRQFDLTGNHKVWWKEDEISKFEELTYNTKEHFNSLDVLPGLKCNGSLTLGENLADYGGLKIAYNTCKKFTTMPEGWEKEFFISYALAWAGTTTEELVRNQTMNDPHSVKYMRVNGTLPMFDAWYEVFSITDKDALYVEPDKRAKIW